MIRINSSNFKKERKIFKNFCLGVSDVFCAYKKSQSKMQATATKSSCSEEEKF
jgi:hypothetical protein